MRRTLSLAALACLALGAISLSFVKDGWTQLGYLVGVRLQQTTPGTPDVGHGNVSGTMRAGMFVGDGQGLQNLNASNLMNGMVPSARLPAPMFLTMNDMSQYTLTVENTAAGGNAIKSLGDFCVGVGDKFHVDAVSGNALSLGTITGQGLASADDTSVGANLSVGGNLDMTDGGIANIGSGRSNFGALGQLRVNNSLVVAHGGSSLIVDGALGVARMAADGIQLTATTDLIFLAPDTDFRDINNSTLTVNNTADLVHVRESLRLEKKLFDGLNSSGNTGDVLTSTSTATKWVPLFEPDGQSVHILGDLIVDGDVKQGGNIDPRIITVERLPQRKATVNGILDVVGGICTNNAVAFKPFVGTALTGTNIRSTTANNMNFFTNSVERVRIDASGNLHVGTTTGPGRLNVNGNLIMQGTGSIFANDTTIAAVAGAGRAFAFVNGGFGEMRSRNNLGADIHLLFGPAAGFVDSFISGAINNAGTAINGGFLRRPGTNTVDLFANGVKPFVEPNPDDPETDIWYAAVEGPEAAMYVRGTAHLVDGRALVELPDHFTALAAEEGMTVQLTPASLKSKGLAVVRQSLSGIEVGELMNGGGSYPFHWEVKAVRAKHRGFKVIRPWEELLLPAANRSVAWEARLRQMREGKVPAKG